MSCIVKYIYHKQAPYMTESRDGVGYVCRVVASSQCNGPGFASLGLPSRSVVALQRARLRFATPRQSSLLLRCKRRLVPEAGIEPATKGL